MALRRRGKTGGEAQARQGRNRRWRTSWGRSWMQRRQKGRRQRARCYRYSTAVGNRQLRAGCPGHRGAGSLPDTVYLATMGHCNWQVKSTGRDRFPNGPAGASLRRLGWPDAPNHRLATHNPIAGQSARGIRRVMVQQGTAPRPHRTPRRCVPARHRRDFAPIWCGKC